LPIAIITVAVAVWYLAGHPFSPLLAAYATGGALIAVVSWLDDIRERSRLLRICFHFLAAFLVVGTLLPDARWLSSGGLVIVALPIAVIWVVGFTNLFNFMDGIDGLAGGQAIVAALAWALIASSIGNLALLALSLAVAASSMGFILHNWSPARIFMGDVGSAFLGYTFAVFPLMIAARADLRVLWGGVVTLWPFAFDGAVTVLRRALRSENIFEPHRQHIYQRLVQLGWSHQAVSLLYLAFAAISSICGVAAALGGPFVVTLLPVLLGFAIFFWVHRLERRSAGTAAMV
jgi:UDP-N-acetylmuramyl pentapeptide phosphotransferase/UDP-N-acetylglucosamine-1-phosphate transferase